MLDKQEKQRSTPTVVPGAALPWQVLGRVGGYIYIYIHVYTVANNLKWTQRTGSIQKDVSVRTMGRGSSMIDARRLPQDHVFDPRPSHSRFMCKRLYGGLIKMGVVPQNG